MVQKNRSNILHQITSLVEVRISARHLSANFRRNNRLKKRSRQKKQQEEKSGGSAGYLYGVHIFCIASHFAMTNCKRVDVVSQLMKSDRIELEILKET